MNVRLAHLGLSTMSNGGPRQTLCLAPNLAREPVAFDAPLLQPLRFREGISALHDVVISDLRFKPRDKDKTAYLAWKKAEDQRLAEVRRQAFARAKEEIFARRETPVPPDFEAQFHRARTRYWDARQKYSTY